MKPEESIDFLLRKNWMAMSRMYNERSAAFGSTMATGFVLLHIDAKHGTPSTALGPKMGMESTSLSRLLKSIETSGLILRKPNPNDKRSVLIVLTPAGLKLRDRSKEIVLELHDRLGEQLTMEDFQHFYRIMDTLANVVESMRK